jgi:hypothetical protein
LSSSLWICRGQINLDQHTENKPAVKSAGKNQNAEGDNAQTVAQDGHLLTVRLCMPQH